MYPHEPDAVPAATPQYQPYLYQSGRFQNYGVLFWTPSSQTPFRPQAATYFSNPPFGRTWDRLFTVEQIVAHG